MKAQRITAARLVDPEDVVLPVLHEGQRRVVVGGIPRQGAGRDALRRIQIGDHQVTCPIFYQHPTSSSPCARSIFGFATFVLECRYARRPGIRVEDPGAHSWWFSVPRTSMTGIVT